MVRAVEHVHARRVLHRDLKPANVFVAPPRRLKLGDFGIARQLSTHTALAGSVVGVYGHRTRSRGEVWQSQRVMSSTKSA
jgi:serine/threonine protein kinase